MLYNIIMKQYFNNFKPLLLLFLIYFIAACSTAEDDEEVPIQLLGIDVVTASSRAPSENANQETMELFLKVSEKNLKQDISYTWYVEEIVLDIDSYSLNIDTSSDEEYTKQTVRTNYFIEKSQNPLNVMLSVYKEGYYKVSVVASNLIETKQKSIVIKVGNPDFPSLQYSFNLPPSDLTADDFVGGFYCKYTGAVAKNDNNEEFYVKASDIGAQWFDTGVRFNPFTSFSITTGTHIVEYNKARQIVSLGKNSLLAGVDGLYYDTDKNKATDVLISPVLLKNLKNNSFFKLYRKGAADWVDGSVYVSSLMWGVDSEDNTTFEYGENTLSKDKMSLSLTLQDKFLAKIFIGSIGQKVPNNKYRVYFSPDGIDSNELDLKKEREYQGLPYGHLIGRLGDQGKTFPIGVQYTYTNTQIPQVYEYDQTTKTYKLVVFNK